RLEGAEGDSRALVGDLDEDLVGAMAGMLLEQRVEVGVGARSRRTHRGRYCVGAGRAVKHTFRRGVTCGGWRTEKEYDRNERRACGGARGGRKALSLQR